jgi:hypothetical protein
VCNIAEPPVMPNGFVRDKAADAALMAALQDLQKR